MRWDLIKPCRNCPFSRHPERIRFRSRERAEEIEEHAYRRGFPCHEHAEHVEEDDDPIGGGGFYFRQDGKTQHCFGALAMHIKSNESGNVPFENACEDDPDLLGRWWDRVEDPVLKDVWDDDVDFVENAIEGKP